MLLEIGPMRPGSLTRQYKDPQHHAGAYWQISYTRRMRSRTEYVRREWVKEIRRQIVTHKRFKRLVDQWIDLSIEHSRDHADWGAQGYVTGWNSVLSSNKDWAFIVPRLHPHRFQRERIYDHEFRRIFATAF